MSRAWLAVPLLLLCCCGGMGSGDAKLASLGPGATNVSVVFEARGTENHFTLVSSRPLRLPAASVIQVRVVDSHGKEILSERFSGGALEPTRWDAPLHGVLLAPLPKLETLSSGSRYRLEFSIEPRTALRQPASIIHHWTGRHWE